MFKKIETINGYIVDLACLRVWPQDEIYERAKSHSRECSLQGNHIESGFALVQDNWDVALLDSWATPLVIDALQQSKNETGIRLRVEREMEYEQMKSILITESL